MILRNGPKYPSCGDKNATWTAMVVLPTMYHSWPLPGTTAGPTLANGGRRVGTCMCGWLDYIPINRKDILFCFILFFEKGVYFNYDQKPAGHNIGFCHICSVLPTAWVAHMSARSSHVDSSPGRTNNCTKNRELAMLCVEDRHQCQPEFAWIVPMHMDAGMCMHTSRHQGVHACTECNSLRHGCHRCVYHPIISKIKNCMTYLHANIFQSFWCKGSSNRKPAAVRMSKWLDRSGCSGSTLK